MYLKDLKISESLKSGYLKAFSDFNFNEYIDRYIVKLRGLIGASLNPLILEPTQTSFKYGTWFFRFTADLMLDDTKVYRLHDVSKSGLPNIKYKDRTLYLSWQMLFPELELTSYYKLKLRKSCKIGEIQVKVKDLSSDVEFVCNLDDLKTRLNRLKLSTNKVIEVQITGEKEGALTTALLKTITNLFKNQILEAVEDSLKETVQETLDGMPLKKPISVEFIAQFQCRRTGKGYGRGNKTRLPFALFERLSLNNAHLNTWQ